MHKAFKFSLILASMMLLLLGTVFVIAGGTSENYITGGIMLIIAFALLGFIYFDSRIEAKRPIHQEFRVEMRGSGEFKDKGIVCKSCGAPLKDENLTVIKGGIMAKCPYCGSAYALEEEPKW